MITTAALNDVLKIQYMPILREMFVKENRLFDLLNQRPKKGRISGAGIRIECEFSPNPTGGPGGATTAYGLTGVPTFDHFSPVSTWYRNRMAVTLEAQDDSKVGDESYVQALERGLKDCIKSFQNHLAQDMYGTRDGALAVVSADVNASATVGLRNGYVGGVSDEHGSRYLMTRQPVNIVKFAGGEAGGNPWGGAFGDLCTCAASGGDSRFLVSAIPNTQQVTLTDLDGNPATFAGGGAEGKLGDIIVRDMGWNTALDIGHAIYGLDEIIDDGSGIRSALEAAYGGLDRSTHPEVDSHCLAKAGLALTTDDLDDLFMGIKHRCGIDPDPADYLLMCHDSVLNSFKGVGAAQVVYTPKTAPLGIDRKYLSYNPGTGDFALTTDRKCPPRTLFAVCLPTIGIYENIPIGFDDAGGILKMLRDANNDVYDIHEAFARCRLQMFCDMPHRSGKITDIGNTRPEFGANPASFVFPPA